MSKVDELKKKLEKQAEKNCVLNDRIHVDCFVSGYLKGSLPREKRIAELEKELKRVKEDNKLLEIRGSDLLKELLDKNKKCKQLEKEKEETRKKVIEIFANDEMEQGELWKACGLRLVGWDYEKNQLDEQFMMLYGVSN